MRPHAWSSSHLHDDLERPVQLIVTERARRAMERISRAVYERQQTEWGGVTFGHLFRSHGRLQVLIEEATDGICSSASAGRVEIESESWEDGKAQLRAAGQRVCEPISTWHSHPHIAVEPSERIDLVAWAGYAKAPEFVGIIVNPYGRTGFVASAWARIHAESTALPLYQMHDIPWAREILEEIHR